MPIEPCRICWRHCCDEIAAGAELNCPKLLKEPLTVAPSDLMPDSSTGSYMAGPVAELLGLTWIEVESAEEYLQARRFPL